MSEDDEREAVSLRADAQVLANTPWVDEPISKFGGRVSKYLATRRSARVPVSRDELAVAAKRFIHKRRPEWHDNGVGIVQGSHYRAGFAAGAEWVASGHDIYPKADRKPADVTPDA